MKRRQLFLGSFLILTVMMQSPRLHAQGQGNQVSIFVSELKAKDPKRRVKAVQGLGRIGPKASGANLTSVQTNLLQATRDSHWEVRASAYDAIKGLGSKKSQLLLPKLFLGLTDRDSDVLAKAKSCISSIKASASQVSIYMDLLNSKHWAIRREAANRLGALGSSANQSIFALIARAQDQDSDVATAVRRAITRVGIGAADRIKLEALLGKSSWKSRWYGAKFLGELGVKARPSIPALVRVASDNDSDVASAAKKAIGKIGVDPTLIPALGKLMTSRNWKSRWYGAQLTGKLGPKGRSNLSLLVLLSGDSDSDVASAARVSITQVGIDASAIPPLLPLLDHKNWKTRWYVAHLLGKLGPKARAAYDDLIKHQRDSDSDVRSEITKALKAIGASRLSLPKLLANFSKESQLSQQRILEDIASLYGNASIPKSMLKPVQRACRSGLKSSSWSVRRTAAKTMGRLGQQARWGLIDLIHSSADRDSDVANAVQSAIPKLGIDKSQLASFKNLLTHRNWKARYYGATFLGRLGAEAMSAVPALIKSAADRDSDVAKAAQTSIPKIGVHESLIPSLTTMLKSPHWKTRNYALSLLGELGPKAQSSLMAVFELLADRDDDNSKLAPKVLAKIGPNSTHLNALVTKAGSVHWRLRQFALRLLSKIGKDNKKLVKTGLKSVRDTDPDVRREALKMLVAIDSQGQGLVAKSFLEFTIARRDKRKKLVQELGQLGTKAQPFTTILFAELDKSTPLRSEFEKALRDIGLSTMDYDWILSNGREPLQLWAVRELAQQTIIRAKTNAIFKKYAAESRFKKVRAAAKKYCP